MLQQPQQQPQRWLGEPTPQKWRRVATSRTLSNRSPSASSPFSGVRTHRPQSDDKRLAGLALRTVAEYRVPVFPDIEGIRTRDTSLLEILDPAAARGPATTEAPGA